MSYSIDQWKTKKLKNLVIPIAAFYKHSREDWHPKKDLDENGNLTLECGCGQTISGVLLGGQFRIAEFHMSGEGSGTFYRWILEPALAESTGTLEAVLIWESGDSITRIKVKDGNVKTSVIEL